MNKPLIKKNKPLLLFCIIIPLLTLLNACTIPKQLSSTETPTYFSGRLSLSQEYDPLNPDLPMQSWSAHFELSGTPEAGHLILYTPVGTTVAKVSWTPQQAMVKTADNIQYFNNLDELTNAYFHQSIPITALFDWLKGKKTPHEVVGWRVDLSRAEHGIIKAQRISPLPKMNLRAVVDDYIENLTITIP